MGVISDLDKVPQGDKLKAYLCQLPEDAPSHEKYESENDSENCPIGATHKNKERQSRDIPLGDFKAGAKELCRNSGIEHIDSTKQDFSDKVKKSFRNFFNDLSNFGMNVGSSGSPSVATGTVSILGGLVPVVGVTVGAMSAFSLNKICEGLATVFASSVEEVARTIFSGFCLASTAIRACLPIGMEIARVSNNPEEKFIFLAATAVMSVVYLLTSSISVMLAGHNAILNSSTTSEMASKVRSEIDSVSHVSSNLAQIQQESLKMISQMLADWKVSVAANFLSFGREFLMLGGAVFSALSALSKFVPVLAVPFAPIIAGSISLVANVVETVQGVIEYRNQKAKLEELRTNKDKCPKMRQEIKDLESQLKLSKIRIAKGLVNVLISIATIVIGALALATPASLVVVACLSAISLAAVLVLSVASLAVRKASNAGAKASVQVEASHGSSVPDNEDNDTRFEEGSGKVQSAGTLDGNNQKGFDGNYLTIPLMA